MTNIISLQVSNVKRLKAVTITPAGNVVAIGGKNGQGKSSVLDSIAMALGGKDAAPAEPIRHGEQRASIVLKTDDLVIARQFTPSGTTLEVRSQDGAKFPSPQAMLDKLCTSVAFDPLQFSRLKPKEQAAQLRALVGLDTSAIDAERARHFDERTGINRDLKSAQAVLDTMPDEDVKPVSVAELLARLEAAERSNANIDAARTQLEALADEVRLAKLAAKAATEARERLETLLADAKVAEEEADNRVEAALAVHTQHEKDGVHLSTKQDTGVIKAEIAETEKTNRLAQAWGERTKQCEKVKLLYVKSEELTQKLARLDVEKEEALKAVDMPIPGLSVDDDGVRFNDVPLEQASAAEKLRVGLAVACAMNPKLKVMLIRDGSLLDEDSMALVQEMAIQHGAQVWVEMVKTEGVSVVIEDGEVKATADY